ncbi:lactate transporter [Sinomonas atrocyanea]|uniref:L-lactate permease n=1 Tax=Sinomonas atrocyanea TaxID=37927 RepID=A0A127A5E1_9MICC|nr:L-lactate permease [Sinomonas atrocyanea]AMM34659.1 lactate transporter [Sinomonas atrocyanea]GEB65918.1 L-lactate permease [Sinomonas atrocyanea]GGG81858.1 L-lactate permease [Sinomonas atrocyanea]
MSTFHQLVDPLNGSLALSAVLAALPLILLFVMLGIFRTKAWKAAVASLVLSIVLAIAVWQMPPGQALSATAEGAFYGVFPILWILINALWVYKLTVATRWFDVLGTTIRSISADLRILVILIAFCFGALLEALAGFGAPVAITAAMLVAAGMKPLKSAMVALLANTAPVAFGAMASPVIALSGVTGIPLGTVSAMAGRQTPFLALIVPLLLVFIVDGRRGVRQTWPAAIVGGVVFAIVQFLTSNFFTVELTDVLASIVAIAAVLLLLRVWQPAELLEADGVAEQESETVLAQQGASAVTRDVDASSTATVGARAGGASATGATGGEPPHGAGRAGVGRPSTREIWMAVAPYLVIIVVFSLSQVPAIKTWLTAVGGFSFRWPALNVVDPAGKQVGSQIMRFDHLKATGTLLLLSGLITLALYRIPFGRGVRIYGETLKVLRWTILTVSAVLALSFVMNLSGQTGTLGIALASAGGIFALLSPVLGWIGVALTGSDTSSNSLFGQLQVTAAAHTGLSPILMAATNSSAGVLGKMLSLQNLAVAAAAVGLDGSESTLFRRLLGWSLGLLVVLTVLVLLQTGPLSWMVP